MVFGSEVMVWDTVGRRKKMDVLERKAMRIVLGLDKGGNDQLIYGEMGENRVSVEAELCAVRYGKKIEKLNDDDVRKLMWLERTESGKDRWCKYVNVVMESLEGISMWNENGLRRKIEKRVKEREEKRWREAMEMSKSSLEVYREVVKRRGEMGSWDQLKDGVRVWWRKFRGGMLNGKRRSNWWRTERCGMCQEEEGGVGHFVFRCLSAEVKGLRGEVLRAAEERVKEDERESWSRLS